jgi:hypothetical protein
VDSSFGISDLRQITVKFLGYHTIRASRWKLGVLARRASSRAIDVRTAYVRKPADEARWYLSSPASLCLAAITSLGVRPRHIRRSARNASVRRTRRKDCQKPM